jgi:glucokinase
MVNVIAIDVGGTTIKGAVISQLHQLPSQPDVILNTLHDQDAVGVINQILEMINNLIHKNNIKHQENIISISVPGLVNSKKGIVKIALNLPKWENIHLGEFISQATGYPTIVENDANCAALGEWHYIYNSQPYSLVFITVSTGIGAGIVIDSKLYSGSNNFAGEFGHMSVDIEGAICHECKKSKGCLTTLCSGTGIINYVRENFNADVDIVISNLCKGTSELITSACVEQAAKLGDALAIKAYERAGKSLGQGIVNLIHLLDPEVVVLGGGVINAADLLFPSMFQTLETRLLDPTKLGIVKKSNLGNMQGIAGASVNAIQNVIGF